MLTLDEKFLNEVLKLVEAEDFKGLKVLLKEVKESNSANFLETENMLRQKLNVIKNSSGDALLHIAVKKGSVEIIHLLLDLELDLDVVDIKGKTPLILAKEYARQHQKFSDIALLLEIKQNWQKSLPKFSFNKAFSLIDKTSQAIITANGHNKILLIGPTGSGKSTLLNWLSGTAYELYNKIGVWRAHPKSDAIEIAKTGASLQSETLYPQVIFSKDADFVYCDLAGLYDSRGKEEQVCAAISAMLLSQSKGDIKGIIVVIDGPSLLSQKGNTLKQTAVALSLLIQGNPKLLDNVLFAFARFSPEILKTILVKDLIEEYIYPLIEIYQNSPEKQNQALVSLLKAIKERKENILIPDIRDVTKSRHLFLQTIKKLKPVSASLFNFNSFDSSQSEFNNVLLEIANGYLARIQKIKEEYPTRIQELEKLKDIENAKIETCHCEIDSLEVEREVQKKIDTVVLAWIKIEELKRQKIVNLKEISQLLKESAHLLDEIKNIEQQKLPLQYGWLSIIVSTEGTQRQTLLKSVLANRRWLLPWDPNANGSAAGPDVLLAGAIKNLKEYISKCEKQYDFLEAEVEQCWKNIHSIELELETNFRLYDTVDRLIDLLGYKMPNYIHFQKIFKEAKEEKAKKDIGLNASNFATALIFSTDQSNSLKDQNSKPKNLDSKSKLMN